MDLTELPDSIKKRFSNIQRIQQDYAQSNEPVWNVGLKEATEGFLDKSVVYNPVAEKIEVPDVIFDDGERKYLYRPQPDITSYESALVSQMMSIRLEMFQKDFFRNLLGKPNVKTTEDTVYIDAHFTSINWIKFILKNNLTRHFLKIEGEGNNV